MNISIGCDHGGFALKENIRAYLEEQGHTVTDVGCKSLESCDYPDFGAAAARLVASGASSSAPPVSVSLSLPTK